MMRRPVVHPARGRERGQILPLTVLMMFVLIGFAGLAIDVSVALMQQRWERSVADGASLAGAQDLQRPGRLLPLAGDRVEARANAMTVLVSQLGATSTPSTALGSPCLTATGCALPGTQFWASIHAGVEAGLPSPACIDCVPQRAVQVNVWQPSFGLTFSRVLGFDTWNVRASSVAGVVFARQFGIVTLRPPNPRNNGSDANETDLFITGGSKVFVGDADVVTNTNVVCSGVDSELILEAAKGFAIYHFDPYQAWVTGSGRCLNPPPGVQMTSPVPDPAYAIPKRTGATPRYATESEAMGGDHATRCPAQQALVPDTYVELKTFHRVNDPSNVITKCFRPGIYDFKLDAKTPASGPAEAFLLEPGVYFFDYGVDVAATLIGGYEPGMPGVALVLLEAKNQSGTPGQMTTSSNTSLLALNFGDAYLNPGGRWATAADSPQGPVETGGPRAVLLTVMVEPDPGCVVGQTAPPAAQCKESENQTLKLTGGGNIFLAGVQYAPSDNASLKGNSGQDAEIGALWAWTITFNSSRFNMRTSTPELYGVLRLDQACSPGLPCGP